MVEIQPIRGNAMDFRCFLEVSMGLFDGFLEVLYKQNQSLSLLTMV